MMQLFASEANVSPRPCASLRQLLGSGGTSRWWKAGALVTTAALLSAILTMADGALSEPSHTAEDSEALIYVPPARFLKVVALGYERALADVLWFRTISYFGHHYWGDRVYPWLAYMCDVVTDLDPRAEAVYSFGGVILPWEADRIDDGIALLEKGVRNIPESWQLSYMLGFSYYFFKDDLAAASRALQSAARLPGAPGYIGAFAALVSAAHQGPHSAVEFLTAIDRERASDEVHGILRERIRELTLSADTDALEAAVHLFGARFQRLPADLSELVSAGLIDAVPPEPFGGRYVLDPQNGHVLSSLGHQPRRLASSKLREAFLKRNHPTP